jgi:hypothetical protein
VVLPTGSGKSLLFQLPALVFGGLTVVVSPLLSLSRDQVLNLAAKGVQAAMVSSEQSPAENRAVLQRIKVCGRAAGGGADDAGARPWTPTCGWCTSRPNPWPKSRRS